MNLINARNAGNGIQLTYFIGDGDVYTIDLEDVSAGIVFPESDDGNVGMGFISVVGKRPIGSQYYYIALDEFESVDHVGLFEALVNIKDRYLIDTICCPQNPRTLVDNFRMERGLTNYNGMTHHEANAKYPYFIGMDHCASLRDVSYGGVHGDIERLISDVLRDNEGDFVLDRKFNKISRLVIPNGMNNNKTRGGVAASIDHICNALWLALYSLQRYGRVDYNEFTKLNHNHKPLKYGGY